MSGAAVVRRFACRSCKRVRDVWVPRCPSCQSTMGFDVLVGDEVPAAQPSAPAAVRAVRVPAEAARDPVEAPPSNLVAFPRPRLVVAPPPEPELADPGAELVDVLASSEDPVPIDAIPETSFVRDSTGLVPLDYVLGGGLVEASVVLLSAFPGSGKSTITLQMLVGLGHRTLYVTGEETREQIAATARRIGAVSKRLYVVAERSLVKIFAHARRMRAQTIAIDSIQKMVCEDVGGRAGTPAQLKECTSRLVHYAKTSHTAMWIIGHVTTDGDVAGPKTVEHDVDVVLELEKGTKLEGRERILRCPGKNRFGATSVAGYFEMTDQGLVALDGDGWNEEIL